METFENGTMDHREPIAESEDFEQLQTMASEEPDVTRDPAEWFIPDPQGRPLFAQDQYTPGFTGFVPLPKKERKKGSFLWKRLASGLLILALVAAACGVTAAVLNNKWEAALREQSVRTEEAMDALRKQLSANGDHSVFIPEELPADGSDTPAQIYAKNVDAVVAISNTGLTTNIFGQVSETASSGSGFVISKDGYIVSNFHVVNGASALSVITADGQEYDARLVGYDSSNDLSVLKIDVTDFPYVQLGSSGSLVVGDQVAAIGNPLGELTSTLTMGYISAKDRLVNTDGTSMNMLQTDAAINSGNSGGPLFNMHGEVIGITTAKYSGTSASGATIEGIGFAIPIDDVKELIDDILKFGYVKTGYLGVMVQDVPQEEAVKYGLPMGALVLDVTEGSCAEKAGLRVSDIIVSVGGNAVTSVSDLTRVLRLYEAGQTAGMMVYRSGSEVELSVTFDAKPQDTASAAPEPTLPQNSGQTAPEDWFYKFWPFAIP